jgi:hypothetical protein
MISNSADLETGDWFRNFGCKYNTLLSHDISTRPADSQKEPER